MLVSSSIQVQHWSISKARDSIFQILYRVFTHDVDLVHDCVGVANADIEYFFKVSGNEGWELPYNVLSKLEETHGSAELEADWDYFEGEMS